MAASKVGGAELGSKPKKNLPTINLPKLAAKTMRTGERGKQTEMEVIEPLTKIYINNKPKDIEFLHYKTKNQVGPAKFYSTLKETQVEKTQMNNLIKQKLLQSEETIVKLRSGKDDTPFVDTFLNT